MWLEIFPVDPLKEMITPDCRAGLLMLFVTGRDQIAFIMLKKKEKYEINIYDSLKCMYTNCDRVRRSTCTIES